MSINRYVQFLVPRRSWLNVLLAVVSVFLAAYVGISAALALNVRYYQDDFATADFIRLHGPLRAVWYCYEHWQGRYSSALVNATITDMTPGVSWYFPLITFTLWTIGGWGISGVLVRRGIIPKMLRPLPALLPPYFTLLLFVRPYEPLYWLAGSTNYGIAIALLFCQAALVLQLLTDDLNLMQIKLRLGVAAALAFFLSGFVELIAPIQIGLYLVAMAVAAICRAPALRRQLKVLAIVTLAAGIGFFLVIHSPGASVRALSFPVRTHGLTLISLTWTFYKQFLLRFVVLEQFVFIPIIILCVAAVKLPDRRVGLKPLIGAVLTTLLIAGVGLGLLFGCFLITTYAMSAPPYHRTTFVPVVIAATAAIALSMSLGIVFRLAFSTLPDLARKWLSPPLILGVCIALLGILAGLPEQVARQQEEYGDEAAYARQWDHGDAYLRSQAGKSFVKVPVNDYAGWHFAEDPNAGMNKSIAEYYHIGALVTYGKKTTGDPAYLMSPLMAAPQLYHEEGESQNARIIIHGKGYHGAHPAPVKSD